MATIIDIVALFIVAYVIALLVGQTTEGGFNLQGVPALFCFLLCIAYYVVLEAQMVPTLGKLALGLRVARVDGGPVDWRAAIICTALRIVDSLFV